MDARLSLAQILLKILIVPSGMGEYVNVGVGNAVSFSILTYSILFYSINLDFWKPKKETKKWFFVVKLKRQVDHLEETFWL